MKRFLFLLSMSVAASACGSTQERQNPWPSAERVQALTQATPTQTATSEQEYAEFEEWEMVNSPQVAGAIPLRAVTPLETLLESESRQYSHLTPTEANTCLAKELAKFLVERGRPTQALLRFIARRCGVVHPQLSYSFITYDGKTDEEAMARNGVANVKDALSPFLTSNQPVDFGIGMFGNEERAVAVISTAQKRVEIQPVDMKVEGLSVAVQGTSLMPNVGHVWASINQGTHGFETCERDVRVVLPAFRFVCNVLPGDPYAAISIGQKEKDKYLGEQAAALFVAANQQPDNVYRLPRIRYELLARAANKNPIGTEEISETQVVEVEVTPDESTDVDGVEDSETQATVELPPQLRFTPLPQIERRPDTYQADIITLVNAVRSGQNLAPIVLEENQSKTVASLAPSLFEATESQVRDEIAMAIMAGWDVGGRVVNGNFQSGWFASTDPVEHLDLLLDEPGGRAYLLDPALSALAIGATLGPVSQVVFAGYHFASEETEQRRIGHVIRQINLQRQQLGLPPATESKKTRAFANSVSSKISDQEMDVDEGAEKLMEKLVANHNRGVRGYWLRVNDLSEIQLPRPVLARKKLTMSIAVGLHQDPGFPWYEYGVIITYLD